MRKVSYLLVIGLAACGGARIIQMTPTGGIIELQGDRSKAMEQATSDMNAKCGANSFTIVKDGDEPVGTQTGTTTPVMAWRIHFQCTGAVGPAAPMPPIDQGTAGPPAPPPPADPNAPVPGY